MPDKVMEEGGELGAMEKMKATKNTMTNAKALVGLVTLMKDTMSVMKANLEQIVKGGKDIGNDLEKMKEHGEKCAKAGKKAPYDCWVTIK